MSYNIPQIFDRINLQQIRNFLLTGGEAVNITDMSYEERLSKQQQYMTNKLKKKYPNFDEYVKIESEINKYLSDSEDIYMELGIQCGAMLMARLLLGERK